MNTRPLTRLTLLIPGGIALLAGLDAALLLLGLPAPLITSRLADVHGPLMVFGFLGTLISLERAVARGAWWAYLTPTALGLGALATLSSLPLLVGQSLVVVGGVLQALLYRSLWRRQQAIYLAVQILGSVAFLAAGILWLASTPIPELTTWFAVYIILTIVGERIELSRVARLSAASSDTAEKTAWTVSLIVFFSPALAVFMPAVGGAIFGAALLVTVGWLWKYDAARGTITATGLPRFMAACLLIGYGWLAIAGALWVGASPITDGRLYDAALHAVFLGFAMSMIMAHAAVILPAVLRRPLPYRPVFWVPAILLHASLLLRIVIGDARNLEWAVSAGGVLNITAVLFFIVIAAGSSITASHAQGHDASRSKKGLS